MFNPSQENSNPESIWDLMGTFFSLIPEEDKKVFERYYESLSRVNSGLFYSLYQAEGLRYFKFQEGWYELIAQEFSFIKEDSGNEGRVNLKKETLSPPSGFSATHANGGSIYSYKITSVNSQGESTPSRTFRVNDATVSGVNPINLSWDSVSGASSYKVYGRTAGSYKLIGSTTSSSFSDTGSAPGSSTPPAKNEAHSGWNYKLREPLVYLSIPTLKAEGISLEEGTDYSIKNHSKLFFPLGTLDNLFTDEAGALKVDLVAEHTIVLSPVLSSFYLKGLGADRDFFTSLPYKPFIDGYSSTTGLDKTLMLGEHYKYLTWGLYHYSKKVPSMYNLKILYSLVKGYPFAYEGGTVESITGSVVTIGSRSYNISTGNINVSVGEEVEAFQILSSGVEIRDWVSHKSTIEGLAGSDVEERLILNLESNYSFPHSDALVNSFKRNSIPAGVRLIET